MSEILALVAKTTVQRTSGPASPGCLRQPQTVSRAAVFDPRSSSAVLAVQVVPVVIGLRDRFFRHLGHPLLEPIGSVVKAVLVCQPKKRLELVRD